MGRASFAGNLVSVIVWNVTGCVFGPEVGHFDVFPLHWSLMFLLKVQPAFKGCPLHVKENTLMNLMNITLYNSVLIYSMCSLMQTMCFVQGKVVHVAVVERDSHYEMIGSLEKEVEHALNYKK